MEWCGDKEREAAEQARLNLRIQAAILRYFAGGDPMAGMAHRTETLLAIGARMSDLADDLDAFLDRCPDLALH